MRVCAMTAGSVAAAILLMSGCNSDMRQQATLLSQENLDLRRELAERNDELAQTRQLLRVGQTPSGAPGQTPLAQVTGFEHIPDVSATFGRGEVTVALPGDVLFAPGKAMLKSSARTSLGDVVSVLNQSYAGRSIRVEGHTDADPIRKSGHKSNYHLAFERAYAVRDYLISNGIAEERVALASYGPNQPRGAKSASRRVEIIVIVE